MKKKTKKKAAKKVAKIEESPFEAHGPMLIATVCGFQLFYEGCDGEDTYVWHVRTNKTGSKLKVTEVVPGLDKRKTRLRSVSTHEELSFTTGKTIEQLVAKWTQDLIGDLEPEPVVDKESRVTRAAAVGFDEERDETDGEYEGGALEDDNEDNGDDE